MRKLALLFLALTAPAIAATTTVTIPITVTTTPTGTTISYPAQSVTVPVPATPTCPTQPPATSVTKQCPSGTTGTWLQTTSYIAAPAPTCWTAVVAPTTAPAGACTPVVVPPPTLTCTPNVISNGKSNWTGNFNYGGLIEADNATAPDGSIAVKFTATATGSPPGGGGYLPFCQNPAGSGNTFVTTPYKFLNITLMATRSGQNWVMPPADVFSPGGDFPAPGATAVTFPATGSAPVNAWMTVKISVGAGGMGLATGTAIWKQGVQDQMPWNGSPGNAAGNVWYIKDMHYSAN